MKISQLRLENTRFFESVNVTDQETNIPGRRNMRIAVREARTGNLTFGAGFSSLERAVVFAEMSQSNFDLFNRRSFFQGDGQKFRLRMQLGSLSSEVVLSFEEPWLFQRQLGLGFSVFRTSSEYNSTFYSQIQTGFEVYLRKHLFELWNGRLSYTYEIFDIEDISPSASAIIQALAGSNASSSIGLQLERDTRDKIINTTAGNYGTLELGVAGGPLGGDNNYYNLEFRGSKFFPIAEFQEQVLAVLGRAGVVDSFGDSDKLQTRTITDPTTGLPITSAPFRPGVPFYDRYFLGGPQTLRGFEFRTVGPKDSSGEPTGGNTYGFLSLEYSMDIVKPVRFAVLLRRRLRERRSLRFQPGRIQRQLRLRPPSRRGGRPAEPRFRHPAHGGQVQQERPRSFNFSFGTRF
jgi:outer membrane protein insertion porin family